MRLLLAASVACLTLSGANLLAADEVYKWVDDNGVTHYQAHPPKNRKNELIMTKTGHSAPSKYGSRRTTSDTANNSTSNEEIASRKSPERCAKARKNLEVLENNNRVRITEENGEKRYLSPEEMVRRKQTAQVVIGQAC